MLALYVTVRKSSTVHCKMGPKKHFASLAWSENALQGNAYHIQRTTHQVHQQTWLAC